MALSLVSSRSLLIALLAAVTSGTAATTKPRLHGNAPRKLVTVDNGIIRVGVDADRGGSITYLSPSDSNDSVINIHDMGREVQLSFYSGPLEYEPSPGSQQCNTTWRKGIWPWNPIGAGDIDGNSGTVIEIQKNDTSHSIYIKSKPLQWACDNVPCNCIFEKWIQLSGTAVIVNVKLSNARKDQTKYNAMGQELPAIYTIGSLYRTVTYNGTSPFSNGSNATLVYHPLGGLVQSLATEHWVALVNDKNWGLGVFQPGTIDIRSGFFGTPGNYGPMDDPTGYLGPYHREILDWNITYMFQFHLVLGNVWDIRNYAYKHQKLIENCLFANFSVDRQHWYYENANDSGIQDGYWHVMVEQNDPQLYGPACIWDTKKHYMLSIRIMYSNIAEITTEARIYWNTYGIEPHFDETHAVSFDVTPDGYFHEIRIDLSKIPSYVSSKNGYGLRFDPLAAGVKGAYVDIAYIELT